MQYVFLLLSVLQAGHFLNSTPFTLANTAHLYARTSPMVVTRVARFRCRQFKKRAGASKPLRVNCSRAFRKPRHLRCSRDSADSQGLAVAGAPVKGLEQKLQETKRLGALPSRMMAGRTLQRLQGYKTRVCSTLVAALSPPRQGPCPLQD